MSQVRDAVFCAGQIALVPCSMQLVKGPAALQARLCFSHMEKVLRAMDSRLTLAHVLQAHIYITRREHAEAITEAWNTKLQDIQVSQSLLQQPINSIISGQCFCRGPQWKLIGPRSYLHITHEISSDWLRLGPSSDRGSHSGELLTHCPQHTQQGFFFFLFWGFCQPEMFLENRCIIILYDI